MSNIAQKFVSLYKLKSSAVKEQKRFKLMYFIQLTLLNISTKGLRKLNYMDQEICRILFEVLDVGTLSKFESCTAVNYLCLLWDGVRVSQPIINELN